MQIPVPVIDTDTGVEYQDTNTSYIMSICQTFGLVGNNGF